MEPPEILAYVLFELPTRKKNATQLAQALKKSGQTIIAHLNGVEGNLRQEEVLRTMIGIERWGQRRLKVAMGGQLVEDTYEAYLPSHSRAWRHLLDDFSEERQDTVELAKDIDMDGDLDTKIPHHDWGPLSPLAWIKYIEKQTGFECRKIR